MNIFGRTIPTYTFRLRIERSEQTILDTTIGSAISADEVAKAKKNIRRLLDEYAPTIKAQGELPTEIQKAETPTPSETNSRTDEVPANQEVQHTEPAAPQSAAQVPEQKPDGAKGLLCLGCSECGNTFGTFLREHQTEIDCKCGHSIDLTVSLAKYRFTCPYCEKETWGRTNLEDPDITVRCKCGENVNLRWNPKAKEYQN